ncbi:MAG: UDP-N-acetylmuramoyl-tripeptide--D-alanyl-D-alanine ligase [Oscillospiraceae bacterium]|nr:UDP-N-acetylmuramoyl-tripeptide--D-alanyl-D-alanine ligase [Oscillospiraceae bacterium]
MIAYSAKTICAAVGGVLLQDGGEPVTGVIQDSRAVRSGDLYVALPGERVDGHDYVDAALQRGAAAVLIARKPETLCGGKSYILVPDTQEALKALACWYREKFSIPFVQITGSAGKTTTKEMIAAVLNRRFCTHKTAGNLNSTIGTPLTLLSLSPEHQAAVIETGMNHFGEIAYMGEMVRPYAAVITNIGQAHMGNLGGTRQGVLQAKCEIFAHLAPDGIAVLNGDDDLLRSITLQQTVLYCGTSDGCQVRVTEIAEHGIEGTDCTVTTPRHVYRVHIAAPGGFMIYPVSMAIAVGEHFGLTEQEILAGIGEYRSVGSRMRLVKLARDRVIIDDCYNANPQAMAQALNLLVKTDRPRRTAVLGDMGELGEGSEQAHRDLGKLTAQLPLDAVIAIGDKAKYLTEENGAVQWFPTVAAAEDALRGLLTPGTAVLVKASRSMAFEQVVEILEQSV